MHTLPVVVALLACRSSVTDIVQDSYSIPASIPDTETATITIFDHPSPAREEPISAMAVTDAGLQIFA